MKILDIYKKYQIMPQLAEHQLRVAAVADMICGNFEDKIDSENIIKACLLHDMGNIVKFDLSKIQDLFPAILMKPEDRSFWESIRQEFIKKYGTGSHNVTAKIVKELGASERIRELVDCVGFDQAVDNAASEDFGKKICAYSDMRVMPLGAASLEERIADLRVRYKNHPEGGKNREVFENSLRKIEQQIFAHINLKPEDITEAAIAGRKEQLLNFEI